MCLKFKVKGMEKFWDFFSLNRLLFKASQGETRFSCSKLGHGKEFFSRTPKQVKALDGIAITQVSCGDDFTCCVSDSGDVFTFGTDYSGCLGLGDNNKPEGVLDSDNSVYLPTMLPFFRENSLRVCRISCGDSHVIALTESNQVFTWGCGEVS